MIDWPSPYSHNQPGIQYRLAHTYPTLKAIDELNLAYTIDPLNQDLEDELLYTSQELIKEHRSKKINIMISAIRTTETGERLFSPPAHHPPLAHFLTCKPALNHTFATGNAEQFQELPNRSRNYSATNCSQCGERRTLIAIMLLAPQRSGRGLQYASSSLRLV